MLTQCPTAHFLTNKTCFGKIVCNAFQMKMWPPHSKWRSLQFSYQCLFTQIAQSEVWLKAVWNEQQLFSSLLSVPAAATSFSINKVHLCCIEDKLLFNAHHKLRRDKANTDTHDTVKQCVDALLPQLSGSLQAFTHHNQLFSHLISYEAKHEEFFKSPLTRQMF